MMTDCGVKENYNVIIIGAGPAGLSAALNLHKCGIRDILVVERFKFPRYKCCAGYITGKTKRAYEALGLDIGECDYSLIKDFKIAYKLKERLKIDNKFLYTNAKIDRVQLDNAFFGVARSEGIAVLEGTKIVGHEPNNNTVTLSNNRVLGYQHLVFADGATGFSGRYRKVKKSNIALQLTFPCDRKEEIAIHFGITKRGYGWVSSYGGTVNVGLTDVYDGKTDYRQVFCGFLQKLNISADTKELKGAFTPIGVRKPVLFDNVYFVGDAVGACDPLTLSGLRYGLASGERCAKAIIENNSKIYCRYARNLKHRFRFMRLMQKAFYLKAIMFLTFCVCCKFFGRMVSYVFNNFFVNKK